MATSSVNNPGNTVSDSTVGDVAITNPNNAQVSDNSYSTATLILNQTSQYLKATNFGFKLPRCKINGITVEIEKSATLAVALTDNIVKIVKADGTIGSTNKASGSSWGNSDAYATYGSATDLWGETWDETDINDSHFGVVISAVASLLGAGVQIDHIRITIDYTAHSFPSESQSMVVVGNGMSRNERAS